MLDAADDTNGRWHDTSIKVNTMLPRALMMLMFRYASFDITNNTDNIEYARHTNTSRENNINSI